MKNLATKKNERSRAVYILSQVLQEQRPLLHLLQDKTSISSLTKELVFGVSRHYFRLEALSQQLLNKKPEDLTVWICLLIGLYQLHYLRIPDYAAVQETVALLSIFKKSWAKGLVNAILRRYCREREKLLCKLESDVNFIHGHPEWLRQKITDDWPQQWIEILASNDQQPPMSLRVNCLQSSQSDYLTKLQATDIMAKPGKHAPLSIILAKPCDVTALPDFTHGSVSVQDEAAQLAVSLLDLKPGLRVLDACCAPGGKTTHILESEPELSSCVALDIDAHRLVRVQENLRRLNLQATVTQGDALHPEKWWDGIVFDRILLDAPCSATGVIRRHPDIKLLREPKDINNIVSLQAQLLKTLWPLLAENGRLLYATCSILAEENEQQIAKFIANQTNCKLTMTPQSWGHFTGHGVQILPGEDNMDGFFYSVLTKVSS